MHINVIYNLYSYTYIFSYRPTEIFQVAFTERVIGVLNNYLCIVIVFDASLHFWSCLPASFTLKTEILEGIFQHLLKMFVIFIMVLF